MHFIRGAIEVEMKATLRLPGTYAAKIDKIRPPLHVSGDRIFRL